MKTKKPPFFGLTGGIGSGKSVIRALFEKHGVPSLDADQVARELRKPGKPGYDALLKRFGTVEPEALKKILLSEPSAKADLESILHPLIAQESLKQLQGLAEQHPHAPFILYEATLLIEAGRKNDFQAIIVVTAPESDRISRVMKRDQCSKERALALIQAQNSDEYRLKHAQYVIKNTGSLLELEEEVRKVLDQSISS